MRGLSAGRNDALFDATCKLGRYVRHGILSKAEVEKALIQATIDNGYTAKKGKGMKAAQATFESAFARTAQDSLPQLEDRPKASRGYSARYEARPGSAPL